MQLLDYIFSVDLRNLNRFYYKNVILKLLLKKSVCVFSRVIYGASLGENLLKNTL